MNKVTVQAGQSMCDVVLMGMGTMQGAMAFCRLNGVALSDAPTAGTVYALPDDDNSGIYNYNVLSYLGGNGVVIGTMADMPGVLVCGLTTVANVIDAGVGTITLTYGSGNDGTVEVALTGYDMGSVPTAGTVSSTALTTLSYAAGTSGNHTYFYVRTKCGASTYSAWTKHVFVTP